MVASGCHELYCNIVEGLAGQTLTCRHPDHDNIGASKPDVFISWDPPVVAGEPERFVVTTSFADEDHPLEYRWDLDGDRHFDDEQGIGDYVTSVTFPTASPAKAVGVYVFPVRIGENSNLATSWYVSFPVLPGNGGSSPTNPDALTVDIDLSTVTAPPVGTSVQVGANVSQNGSPASGATVDFDFESDGTSDVQRTTGSNGRAVASHRYANGTHQVTVTARLGDATGSATRTFTYTDGQISGKSAPAAARASRARGSPFSGRLTLAPLRSGKLVKRRDTVSRVGELALGRLAAKLGTGGEGLAAFRSSRWITRSTITVDRRRRRTRVAGVALVTFARTPGEACVRYSISARARRKFGKGTLRLLGGSDAAATMRAVATVRVAARRGRFGLNGRIRTGSGEPRALPAACQAILEAVRTLPP